MFTTKVSPYSKGNQEKQTEWDNSSLLKLDGIGIVDDDEKIYGDTLDRVIQNQSEYSS